MTRPEPLHPVEKLIDRIIVEKRAAQLDRAVTLGIINYNQRCALLELCVTELAEMHAEDEALRKEIERGNHEST